MVNPRYRTEIKTYYVCDGKKCKNCVEGCRHTTDISHAKYHDHIEFKWEPDSGEWEVIRE